MVTTTIALDEKTHYRLRQLALDERTTARDLIRAAPGAALVMRGQGRIFQRGGVWWIAYYHHALIRRRAGRRALQAPEKTSAGRGIRTPTGVTPADFKSAASASSAIPAGLDA